MNIIKRIRNKAFRVLTGCDIIHKTNWYNSLFLDSDHKIYPDNYWYRENDERNFDVVNLGSSSAKFAFDYEGIPLKCMNWAQAPQTLQEDYNLLRHFHSILHEGGYVIITVMPFTGINKKTGIYDALKYLHFNLQGEPIEPYLYDKAVKIDRYPILLGKRAAKEAIKYILGRDRKQAPTQPIEYDSNPLNDEQLEADALAWINGWKEQFDIKDLEAPLTPQNVNGRKIRIALMRELIDFCKERGYKPVYVIPPVTPHLSEYFTPKFEDLYIYNFLKQVDRDIPTLDYSKELRLKDKELYFNSFFLNRNGRRKFTNQVLTDLNLLH